MYLWGEGLFGQFHTPHRVKKIPEIVTEVSIGEGFGAAITLDNKIYSWGLNHQGQLGRGDFESTNGPRPLEIKVKSEKNIRTLSCGANFVVSIA